MTRHSQGEADKADQQMNSSQLCPLWVYSFAPSNNWHLNNKKTNEHKHNLFRKDVKQHRIWIKK